MHMLDHHAQYESVILTCYQSHARFDLMTALVIVDEFDCDTVALFFFLQRRSVSLRTENRK